MRISEISQTNTDKEFDDWLSIVESNFSNSQISDKDNKVFISDGKNSAAFDFEKNIGYVDFESPPQDELVEVRQVWAKRGNKVIRKYRCTSGIRRGRIVSNPAQCNAPVNIKQRQSMKKIKARLGGRMSRRAQRTKKINPVSQRLRKLNKR